MNHATVKNHPIQPLEIDGQGVVRFKANAIVQWLLDEGPFDLNDIARKGFAREDHEQFAQLIGYSHGGAGDLAYMSDEVLDAAERQFQYGGTEGDARAEVLREQLARARGGMREGVAALFQIHPEDLETV